MANDKTVNGVIDVEKRTERGQKWIEEGLVEDNHIVFIKLSLIDSNPEMATRRKLANADTVRD
jgi:hypothetical protein